MANIPFGDYEIPIFNKYILEAKKDFGGSIFGVCVFQGRDFQTKEPLVFKLGYLDSNEDSLISHEYEMLNKLEINRPNLLEKVFCFSKMLSSDVDAGYDPIYSSVS